MEFDEFLFKKGTTKSASILKRNIPSALEWIFHRYLHFTNNILNFLYFQYIQAFICYE